jgi:hypothetical protein
MLAATEFFHRKALTAHLLPKRELERELAWIYVE